VSPASVHLFASLIRQQRGTLTAFEKWARSHPRSAATEELLVVIDWQRGMLTTYEQQLSRIGVEVEVGS
jgi:hypothetical protein